VYVGLNVISGTVPPYDVPSYVILIVYYIDMPLYDERSSRIYKVKFSYSVVVECDCNF